MNYEPIPHGNGWKVGEDYYAAEDGWTPDTIEVLARVHENWQIRVADLEKSIQHTQDEIYDAICILEKL